MEQQLASSHNLYLRNICRYTVVIYVVTMLFIQNFSGILATLEIFKNFPMYKSGGSVRPVKQIIKLTWCNTEQS